MSDTMQDLYPLSLRPFAFDRIFSEGNTSTFLNIRSSALLETVAFLTVIVLSSFIFSDGTRYIDNVFHPFWIIVLLVTVQYGLKESLAASLLASGFLLVGNLPEQTMAESTYEYTLRAFSQPVLWLSASLILGGIRERQLSEKQRLIDGYNKMKEEAGVIVNGYTDLKHAKEQLEIRLSEEQCSLLSVYDIARSLETLDPQQALAAAEKLVRKTLSPVKFSVYKLERDALSLEAAWGWEQKDEYKTQFDKKSYFTRRIVKKKRVLNIVNGQDENLLNGQGLMAGPIYDEETGKVFGMLKIEDANFMNLGIRTQETFRIVCSWIAHVLANIEKYQGVTGPHDFDSEDITSVGSDLPNTSGHDECANISIT